MPTFTLPTVPGDLNWRKQPLAWQLEPGQSLNITAGAKTDLFFDPAGGITIANAPAALFTPIDENFILSAQVTVDFASAFDAGVLHLRGQDDVWAKLCFEYSPQQQPMIVSVVTRGFSDDCNSTVIAGNQVYLRLACNGPTIAFHYSLDGNTWHLVRYFTLGKLEQRQVGFWPNHLRARVAGQSFLKLATNRVHSEIFAAVNKQDFRSSHR